MAVRIPRAALAFLARGNQADVQLFELLLGPLGLLLELSVQVLPRAFAETTLCLELPEIEAIRRLNEWGGQPLPVSGSCWLSSTYADTSSGAMSSGSGLPPISVGQVLVMHARCFHRLVDRELMIDDVRHDLEDSRDDARAAARAGSSRWLGC